MRNIIYVIIVILVLAWFFGGVNLHLSHDAKNIIIVIAVILLLYNLFGHRGSYRKRWW
jgi:hypothetical protein